MNRRGFTLIELMVVVLVMAVLAGMGLLRFIDLRNTARTAEVTGDFRSIAVAAYNYQADGEVWPADGAPGVVPPVLVPLLPGGFRFDKGYYVLDYENIPLGTGAFMIGVTVTTSDADLMQKLIRNLGGRAPFFVAGASLTYIIVGASGAS